MALLFQSYVSVVKQGAIADPTAAM